MTLSLKCHSLGFGPRPSDRRHANSMGFGWSLLKNLERIHQNPVGHGPYI